MGTSLEQRNEDGSADSEFRDLIRRQLELLGEDPDRQGLLRTPERVAKSLAWLTRGYEMDVEEYDFRTGGRYRYTHRDGAAEYRFNGVFHVVRDNEFAIQTFEFEGVPDVVSIESVTFEPLEGGRTRVRAHAVYPTVEARDGMVASGMERGVIEGYEQLDEVLAGA